MLQTFTWLRKTCVMCKSISHDVVECAVQNKAMCSSFADYTIVSSTLRGQDSFAIMLVRFSMGQSRRCRHSWADWGWLDQVLGRLAVYDTSGAVWGWSWAVLCGPCVGLGPSWAVLGLSWSGLGQVLGCIEKVLRVWGES